MKSIRRRAPHVLVGVLLLLIAGCGGEQLISQWLDREITIDGRLDEWEGVLTSVEEANASVGLLNDDEYLYIGLATDDRMRQMQVLGGGLTIWFDPDGGKERVFGIRFPLGALEQDPLLAPGERPTPEQLTEALDELTTDLEITDPGYSRPSRMPVVQATGIEVDVDVRGGILTYELKVPIERGSGRPWSIEVAAGEPIGIGLQTPEIDREAMGERMAGRGGGMGRSGGGGGRGGKGGGGRGGGRGGFQPPEPLDVWATVQTAAPTVTDNR